MRKLTKEQRELLEKLKNLCSEALENNSADNLMTAFGNCFMKFGVFLPKKFSPLFQIFSEGVDKFKEEILGRKVKGEQNILEYWEKELDRMDKKKGEKRC